MTIEQRVHEHLDRMAQQQRLPAPEPLENVTSAARKRTRRRRGALGVVAAMALAIGSVAAVDIVRDDGRSVVAGQGDGVTTPSTTPPPPDELAPQEPAATPATWLRTTAIVSTPGGHVAFGTVADEAAVHDYRVVAQMSADGTTWVDVPLGDLPAGVYVVDAAYHDGTYYLASQRPSSSRSISPLVLISRDLANWTEVELAVPDTDPKAQIWGEAQAITAGEGGVLASGSVRRIPDFEALGFDPAEVCTFGGGGAEWEVNLCNGETVPVDIGPAPEDLPRTVGWSSPDGTEFDRIDMDAMAVVAVGDGFVSANFDQIQFLDPDDGSDWVPLGTTTCNADASSFSGQFVASDETLVLGGSCGTAATVWTSIDGGSTWETISLPVPADEARVPQVVAGPAGFAATVHFDPTGSPSTDPEWPSTITKDGYTLARDVDDGSHLTLTGPDGGVVGDWHGVVPGTPQEGLEFGAPVPDLIFVDPETGEHLVTFTQQELFDAALGTETTPPPTEATVSFLFSPDGVEWREVAGPETVDLLGGGRRLLAVGDDELIVGTTKGAGGDTSETIGRIPID